MHALLPDALGARVSQRQAQLRDVDRLERKGLVVHPGFGVEGEELRHSSVSVSSKRRLCSSSS